MTSRDWIAFGGVIASLLVSGVAIWGERLRCWWRRHSNQGAEDGNVGSRWPVGDVKYRLLLLSVFVIGLVLVLVPSLYSWDKWDYGIPSELGKAAIIAGILGFTIDPWIRTALARDVFSAAFGYYMPDDFKTEIRRIVDHKVLCTKHIMDVRIQDTADGNVKITIDVVRTFLNIGTFSVPIKAMVWLDELGFDEPIEILKCEVSNKRGTKHKIFDPKNIQYRKDFSAQVKTRSMLLRPQDNVTTVLKYSVIRRRNDYFVEWFMMPTRNPEIHIIEIPNDMDADAGFGGSSELKTRYIRDRYELDGVYFAPAVMKIRWWPRKAVEDWRYSHQSPRSARWASAGAAADKPAGPLPA
jgi:hypothetical protein